MCAFKEVWGLSRDKGVNRIARWLKSQDLFERNTPSWLPFILYYNDNSMLMFTLSLPVRGEELHFSLPVKKGGGTDWVGLPSTSNIPAHMMIAPSLLSGDRCRTKKKKKKRSSAKNWVYRPVYTSTAAFIRIKPSWRAHNLMSVVIVKVFLCETLTFHVSE